MQNNPILLSDHLGDTSVVDKVGNIIRMDFKTVTRDIYNPMDRTTTKVSGRARTDNLVYMKNDNGTLTKIGEFGKTIDISTIYSNLLAENYREVMSWRGLASSGYNFYLKVKGGGDWDYKIQTTTLYGYVNQTETKDDGSKYTKFNFQGLIMEPQDIGNHHYGVMGLATNVFTENMLLIEAGRAQIKSKTSKPEWIKEVHQGGLGTRGVPSHKYLLPPYGDDPRDQGWIKEGFEYYYKNKPLLYNSYKQFSEKQAKERGNGGPAGMGGHAGKQPTYQSR